MMGKERQDISDSTPEKWTSQPARRRTYFTSREGALGSRWGTWGLPSPFSSEKAAQAVASKRRVAVSGRGLDRSPGVWGNGRVGQGAYEAGPAT